MNLKLIDRQAHTLACWDVGSPPSSMVRISHDAVVVSESQIYTFMLEGRLVSEEFTLSIGDHRLEDMLPAHGDISPALGYGYGDNLLWMEFCYFESARGHTPVRLYGRLVGASSWRLQAELPLYVLPAKLGEERYNAMVEELNTLCGGLMFDLLGKSKRSFEVSTFSRGISFRPKELELNAVAKLWEQLGPLIKRIQCSPSNLATCERSVGLYWGDRPLKPDSVMRLVSTGISPNAFGIQRPLKTHVFYVRETTATVEHRTILAFLYFVRQRILECIKAIESHICALEADRRYRDVLVEKGPSLFEVMDLPRIRLLKAAGDRASALFSMVSRTARLPIFQNIKPLFSLPHASAFEQNPLYQRVKALMREFLASSLVWAGDDGESATLKLTSRLYENWVFIQLVDAFRSNGLSFEPWNRVLSETSSSRFTIDFERGLSFIAPLTGLKWLRVCYEPWILGKQEAINSGSSLFRSGPSAVPWSPDILIECLVETPEGLRTLYAVVVDCKYTAKIRDDHWIQTRKYLEIRSVATEKQVVRQLWLVHPGLDNQVICSDAAVTFSENGLTCAWDEAVTGVISAVPMMTSSDSDDYKQSRTAIQRFVQGTIAYFSGVSTQAPS